MAQNQHTAYGSAEALAIYRELGELTEKELVGLHHDYSRVGRMNYFRNIYGYYAGAIARGVYERWASGHECSKCPV